jgi:hypothetical protein
MPVPFPGIGHSRWTKNCDDMVVCVHTINMDSSRSTLTHVCIEDDDERTYDKSRLLSGKELYKTPCHK